MMKNRLFTTSILVAATAAAGFLGCSSNSGSDSSVGSGSGSGSVGSGSSGSGGASSTGSGSSSGAGQTADAAACVPADVPNGNVPPYVAVVGMAKSCDMTQISGFISSCVTSGATSNGCEQWANANSTCAACIVQGTDAGPAETGAILFDTNSSGMESPASANVPGCIAIADPTNGPACATQLEPLMQCVALACPMCADQTSFSNCEKAARASNGTCGGYSSMADSPCSADMASSGVAVTQCGYGTDNELVDVINVICGSGP
jgi:hypothetical protein